MLDEPFIENPVVLEEEGLPDKSGDGVLLVDDGDVTASNTISEVVAWIMQANVDAYSGGAELTTGAPEVIAASSEVPFHLTGYPEANRQKQILTAVSRHIEMQALANGDGRLRTAFQRLSRIDDEYGTRAVYSRATGSDLDVHLYGIPDWVPRSDSGVIIHGGFSGDFRQAWFVLYTPPDGTDGHTALVALHTDDGVCRGFFTEDKERVEMCEEYVTDRM